MASRTIVQLVDDIDGSEATETVNFALDGVTYEMDLNDGHAAEFRAALTPWLTAARRTRRAAVTTRRRPSSSTRRGDLDEVRAWARKHGHPVSDRGRIAGSVLDAYDAVH